MGAGDSARREAEALSAAEARLRRKADYLAEKAGKYERGADGEARLTEILGPLAADGYFRLDDLGIPGTDSNIDLVLLGPAGVFVMDAKNWSGSLSITGRELRQNDERRAQHMERLRVQVAIVAEAVDGCLPSRKVAVWPAMVFVGSGSIGKPTPIDRVHLMDGDDAVAYVRSFPVVLGPDDIQAVGLRIFDRLAPRTSRVEHRGDAGVAHAPPEPVVFLTPWNKYGKRRIYVKDELGLEGGYLDLISGEIVGTTPSANAVLAQLLPHYATGDTPMDLNETDRGAIKRFLAWFAGQPRPNSEIALVAGYRWARSGRQRLYVHHLQPGGHKTDLGWMDLTMQRVHADVAGAEPIVRYCGERYLAVNPPKG